MVWPCCRRVVLALVCAPIVLPAAAQATDIPVTTTADSMTTDGQCSLREALWAANNSSPVNADCQSGGAADTILVPTGMYPIQLNSTNEDLGNDGDFDVRSVVTIRGDGAAGTIIDGAGRDRVLHVALPAASLVLDRVTVRGGLTANGTGGLPGTGGGNGAGILNVGTLTVMDSVIRDNQTGVGGSGTDAIGGNGGPSQAGGTVTGAAGGNGGSGGGIFSSGSLTVTRSSIAGNVTGGGGAGGKGTGGNGGDGPQVLNASAGAGGAGTGGAGGQGGSGAGIFSSGSLELTDSTVADNGAGAAGAGGAGFGGTGGGGEYNGTDQGSFGGAGGAATGGAGGAGAQGGGIRATGTSTITRATFQGNHAGAGGAGGAAGGLFLGHGGVSSANNGGDGGASAGGAGGAGGSGGALSAGAQATLVNVTVTGNAPGTGAAGGSATGGDGGQTGIGASNADGGSATGGAGGSAGGGGALAGILSVTHATVDANAGATAGSGGGATAGTLQGSGAAGTATPGAQGAGGGGAVANGGTTTLINTIVAANSPANCSGGVTDGNGNISFGDASCPGANGDPKLGALQANGGQTQTQALGAGSSALDKAGAGACAATDQRGVTRPQGPGCDVGAFEAVVQPGGGGAGTGGPGGSGNPLDKVAPVFASASLSRKTFQVDPRGPAETAVSARAKAGTTFRYVLSESARVVFTIARASPGRRVGRTCRKPTAKNRRRPRCTLYVVQGRFAQQSRSGPNQKPFSGRIGRKALKPGNYRATVVATDPSGNSSRPRVLTFKVVRR